MNSYSFLFFRSVPLSRDVLVPLEEIFYSFFLKEAAINLVAKL